MATCRDCAHYDLEAFRIANGKIRMAKGKMARCMFDMDRLARKFPASLAEYNRPKRLQYMEASDGAGCPQWTQRKVVAERIEG